MTPQQQADKVIGYLIDKIETAILMICIGIITFCLVYAYLLRPFIKEQPKEVKVAYEKFRTFSMPIGDVRGTEEYEDETVKTYTDDWGIRHELKRRIK